MFSNRDFDLGIGGHTKKPLSNRDRLLRRVQTDFKYLFRTRKLADEPLELTLLLIAFARGRAQLACGLGVLVHKRRVGFANLYHVFLFPALDPFVRPRQFR